MAQASWRRACVAVLGASLMILGGCGMGRNTEVKESWLARVPEERLVNVRQAEALKRQATDNVLRADVAIEDAGRALDIARRNAEAAKLRKDTAKAQVEAAKATGQQASIQQAEGQLQAEEAALAAARAQVAWRKENMEAWNAQKELRQRELQVADAELNHAQYRALKENGDVRAQQLTEGDFLSVLSKARRETLEARRDVDEQMQEARQARAQWERLREQAQGYGGSGWDQR
jgi:colicin import membrane protein